MNISKRISPLAVSLILCVILALTLVGCGSKDGNKTEEPAAEPEKAAVTPAAPTSSYDDIQPVLSSTIPLKLELDPNKPVVETNRPFFDQFSWQSFIALCWPADTTAERGTPLAPNDAQTFLNANKSGAPSVPVVWDTYRTSVDLFPQSGEPPAWNAPDAKRALRFGKSRGAARTKPEMSSQEAAPDDFWEATNQPLIDQNKNYALYGITVNKTEYTWVSEKKWYIRANIPNPATLPFNSIEIKSAWRPMITETDPAKPWEKLDDMSRYYVVDAEVPDPCDETKTIRMKIGLVGLHIIQKTEKFTEWIWTTFEQVDNITVDPASGLRPSYNNGTPEPPSPKGYNYLPSHTLICDAVKREPVQTTRLDGIPDTPAGTAKYLPDGVSTQGMNKTYQGLVKGTVWENYQLVRTQWPSDPSKFKVSTTYDPDYAGVPFPVNAANVTLETYSQQETPSGAPTSCMQCHYGAVTTDFSFMLLLEPKQ